MHTVTSDNLAEGVEASGVRVRSAVSISGAEAGRRARTERGPEARVTPAEPRG